MVTMASRTWFSRRCGLAPGGLPCGLPGVPREGCTDRGRQCGSCAGTEAGQWDCRWTAVGLAVGTAGSGAHLVFLGALDDTQKGDPGRRRRRVRVRVRVNVSQGQGQCQVSRGGQGAKGPRGQGAKGPRGQGARGQGPRAKGALLVGPSNRRRRLLGSGRRRRPRGSAGRRAASGSPARS